MIRCCFIRCARVFLVRFCQLVLIDHTCSVQDFFIFGTDCPHIGIFFIGRLHQAAIYIIIQGSHYFALAVILCFDPGISFLRGNNIACGIQKNLFTDFICRCILTLNLVVSLLVIDRLTVLPVAFAGFVFPVPLIPDFVCIVQDNQLISVRIEKLFPEWFSIFIAFTGHPRISIPGIDQRFPICIIIFLFSQQVIAIFVFDGKSTFRARNRFFVFVVVFCPIQTVETVEVF